MSSPLKPLQCELQLRDEANSSMGMLLYTLNTKTELESDPPILVLHKLPLFQFFMKEYDIIEVPQVVFICLEMNEIPWWTVEVFKMRAINIISMKHILPY